jgi:hypothetical protein
MLFTRKLSPKNKNSNCAQEGVSNEFHFGLPAFTAQAVACHQTARTAIAQLNTINALCDMAVCNPISGY